MYRPGLRIRRKAAFPGSNAAHYPDVGAAVAPLLTSLYLQYDGQNINLLGNVGINDTDLIGTWKNAGTAGSAGDLTQAVGANKPAFKKIGLTGKLNNLSTISFINGKSLTVAAGLTINQPDLIAIVVKTAFINGVSIYQGSPGSFQQLSIDAGTSKWQLYAGTTQDASITVTTNSYHLLLTTWNAASTIFRGDLVAGSVGGTVGAGNLTGFSLSDPGGTVGVTGEIAEVLVYTGTLPTAAAVEAYFQTKYGSTWPQ